MLFVTRADIDRVQEVLASVKLYDAAGTRVGLAIAPFSYVPDKNDAETGALAGITALVSMVYRRQEIVWPADTQAFGLEGHPLFVPPTLPA